MSEPEAIADCHGFDALMACVLGEGRHVLDVLGKTAVA